MAGSRRADSNGDGRAGGRPYGAHGRADAELRRAQAWASGFADSHSIVCAVNHPDGTCPGYPPGYDYSCGADRVTASYRHCDCPACHEHPDANADSRAEPDSSPNSIARHRLRRRPKHA